MANEMFSEADIARCEREAAEWFFRRQEGLSAEETAIFARWRAIAAHAMAFAEIERTWNNLGELPGPLPSVAPRRRGPIFLAGGLAAAAAIAVAIWVARPAVPADAPFAEQAATEVGGLRRLDLPDGSFVTLNTNSSVDVQFTAASRRVRLLRGEAHFEVAKDTARPFVVEATGVAVQAVGTAFNVRMRDTAVDVLVTEGRVRVDDIAGGASLLVTGAVPNAAQAALLHAGERVTIDVGPGSPARASAARIETAEIDQVLAWRQRRLDYTDAPLSEIVADFNRYNQHRLVIADATLAGRRFGGSFAAGDYASLVQLLEKTFGVATERRERETVLRLP